MIVSCLGMGVGGESRIAIGEAYLLRQGRLCITPGWIDPADTEREILRFESALRLATEQLRTVRSQVPGEAPSEVAEFIDTHLMMIEDRVISSGVIQMIREQNTTAEWALQQHRNALVEVFEQMQDGYLRTRRDDLDHVVRRIHKVLLEASEEPELDLRGRIVLADDLSPADVILLHNQHIAGFVTDYGGPMSHTAILARSLGLPAVIGTRGASSCMRHGELLVLDTGNGSVMANCPPSVISQFEDRREYEHERIEILRRLSSQPSLSEDGVSVGLLANIELAGDVDLALQNGADGVGLYRTEFLYMNRNDAPSEAEHYAAYRQVIDGVAGKAVTIRTLDLGADKQISDNPKRNCGGNPALGLRAIRLCLKEPELFRPQIRAILRVSAFGDVRIMLPMLTNLWEVEQARSIIHSCMQELDLEGIPFNPEIKVGGMIEVPAAALNAEAFARELDFLSIGTNDLIQYTLAIDRIDDEVNYLYDPFHPAVIQLIAMVIQSAQRTRTPLSMCGEMAGDSRFLPLLLGMGLRNLSMQPAALLDAKQLLPKLNLAILQHKAEDFLLHMHNEDPLALLSRWQD